MIVYITMLLLSILTAYTIKKYTIRISKNKKISFYSCIIMLPFWFVTCFRYQVGTDYITYTELYSVIIPNESYKSDFLFSVLVRLCVNFFHNNHLIIVIIGTLTIFLMARFIEKESKNIIVSIILFFLTGSFFISLNLMKQMLATVIWLNSLTYIRERKFVQYIIVLFIAAGFHRITLLYFFLYFLYERTIPIKKSFPVFIGFIYIFSEQIRNFIIIITRQFNFYYGYFYNSYDKRQGSGALLVINIFAFVLVFLFIQNAQKRELYIEKDFNFFYNIQLLCLIFCVLMPILPNGERIVYLLMPVQIISIPTVLHSIQRKKMKYIIIMLTIGIYSVFFIELFIMKNTGGILPYKFIF